MNAQTFKRYEKIIILGVRRKDVDMIKKSNLNNFRKAYFVKRLIRLQNIPNKIDHIAEVLLDFKNEVKITNELENYIPHGLRFSDVTKRPNRKVQSMLSNQHTKTAFATGNKIKTKDTIILNELKALQKQLRTERKINYQEELKD